jgi:hypothetical protein
MEVMLEALRPQERIDQVDAYGGGDDGGDYIFHTGFSQRRKGNRKGRKELRWMDGFIGVS